MKKANKESYQFYPIPALREALRRQATELSAQLSRSVARLTSCDSLPCLEYGEEIKTQHIIAEKLFFVQQTRNAIEQCIAGNTVTLRYRWSDGKVTQTKFRKSGPNQVRVSGLPREVSPNPFLSKASNA